MVCTLMHAAILSEIPIVRCTMAQFFCLVCQLLNLLEKKWEWANNMIRYILQKQLKEWSAGNKTIYGLVYLKCTNYINFNAILTLPKTGSVQ